MKPLSVEDCLNKWTPEQLAANAARATDNHPVRYFAKPRPIPFLGSFWWWIIKRKWIRYETTFEPVFYGDPRYEIAPFEAVDFVRRMP